MKVVARRKGRTPGVYVGLVVVAVLAMAALYTADDVRKALLDGLPQDRPAPLPNHLVSAAAQATVPLGTLWAKPYLERAMPYSRRRFQYIIRSTASRHQQHLSVSLATWGLGADVAFVSTDVASSKGLSKQTAHVPLRRMSKEPGHNFGRKALKTLAAVCDEVNHIDFWVFVDDDTLVVVPTLEGSVGDAYDPDVPLYGGCAFSERPVPLVSVGGGMVLSRGTMRSFCRHVDDEDHACSWLNDAVYQLTGDQAIAECMKAMGITTTHIHGFNQLSLRDITANPPSSGSCGVDWLPKNYQCNPPVSRLMTVRCSPEEMRELYYFTTHMVDVLDAQQSIHPQLPSAPGTTPWRRTHPSNVSGEQTSDMLSVRVRPYSSRRFAYTILTTAEHHRTRLLAALRTWATDAWLPFVNTDVVTLEDKELFNGSGTVLASLGELGRHDLGRKTMRGVVQMCTVDADYFVFVDDDCFVFVSNLEAHVARAYDPRKPLYLGATLTHLKQPFISGGGGILVSSATMQRICEAVNASAARPASSPCHPDNPAVWTKPGDTAIMDCMVELGVAATHDDGFHPLRMSDMVDYGATETSCNVWWIPSAHKCRPPSSITLTSHYTPPEKFPWYHYVATRMVVQRSVSFNDPPGGAWMARRMPSIPDR